MNLPENHLLSGRVMKKGTYFENGEEDAEVPPISAGGNEKGMRDA
jgi:hypothetical protein